MTLQAIMIEAHSGIRWIVVAVGIIALVRFSQGWLTNLNYGKLENQLWAALKWSVRVQLILGLIVLIWGFVAFFSVGTARAAEHAFTNIIAVAVVEISASRASKGTNDKQRFMTSAVGVLVAAVLIFLGVARVAGWS